MNSLKRLFSSIIPSSWTSPKEGDDLLDLSPKQIEQIEQSFSRRKLKKVKRRLPPSTVSPPASKAKFLKVGANGMLQEQSEIEEPSPALIPSDKGNEVQSKELVLSQKSEGQNSENGEFTATEVLALRNHHLGKNLKRRKTEMTTQFPAEEPALPEEEEPKQIEQLLRPTLQQVNLTHQQEASADLSRKGEVINAFEAIEGLTCPICMDFIIGCRIAICGHSFCHQCISECLIRKKDCPQCRKPIRRKMLQMSLIVDNAVKMKVYSRKLGGYQDDFERWEDRINKYHEWLDKHSLSNVKAGDRIDACDTELVWCRAVVELVVKSTNRKDLLYLHYEGWNRKYDEYLYIDSHRVAPLGLYTERTDIPKYRMNNRNSGLSSMMYAVVLQNAAEEARMADYERRMQMRREPVPEDQDMEEQPPAEEEEHEEEQRVDDSPVAENIMEPPPLEAANDIRSAEQQPEDQNLQQQPNPAPSSAPDAQLPSSQPSEPQQITERRPDESAMFGDQKIAFEKLKAQQEFKNRQSLQQCENSQQEDQPAESAIAETQQEEQQQQQQEPLQDPVRSNDQQEPAAAEIPGELQEEGQQQEEQENQGSSLVDYSEPTNQGKK